MYIFFYEYIITYNYKFRYKNNVYIFAILSTFHLLTNKKAYAFYLSVAWSNACTYQVSMVSCRF